MTNAEIARLFNQMAAAYTVKGENFFRTNAYEKAAETVQNSPVEVKDLWQEGKLSSLPGIGSSIASHLDELFKTGRVRHFEETFKGLPKGMFALLDVPGFGPKKAFRLSKKFDLTSEKSAVEKLFEAACAGKIVSIEGFGEKSQEDIIAAIKQYKRGQIKGNRMPLPFAYAIADELLAYLKKHSSVIKVEVLGSLRRRVSTIGDIDLAVATRKGEDVLDYFLTYPKKTKVVERGPTGASILLTNGRQVDLRVIDPTKWGSMLQYFTGSKAHNIKLREFALKQGLSLNEYGMKPIKRIFNNKFLISNLNKKKKLYEFSKEEDFYSALSLPWIPPEIREDTGEIEAWIQNKFPHLVELKDIKGDFHIHSNYDLKPSHDLGNSSIEMLVKRAGQLGYEYIGISDHNPSYTNQSHDKIVDILKRRKEFIDKIIYSTKSTRVHLFIMCEVDILPDGKLPIPDKGFEYLDACIVSIHSSFNQDKKTMTNRILSGLSHPKARILAHPTGRLLTRREGYEVDWEKLFSFVKDHNKAIEINAYPDRLDLPDILVRQAIHHGVKLTIDTDSHDVSHMDLMQYGVSVARRGWATGSDIINTMAYNKVKEWILG